MRSGGGPALVPGVLVLVLVGCVSPRSGLGVNGDAGGEPAETDGPGSPSGGDGSGAGRGTTPVGTGDGEPGGPEAGRPLPLPDGGTPPPDAPGLLPPDASPSLPPDASPAIPPDARMADPACGGGSHRCPSGCALDSDESQCGVSCRQCPAPAGGQALCQVGTCEVRCNASYHRCGDSCYPDTDPAHCGDGCETCSPVDHGASVCEDGSCAARCNAGTLACSGLPPACLVPTWGFESGTTDGWALKSGAGSNSAGGTTSVSTARSHGGSHALASKVSVNFAQSKYVVTVHVPLCASGGVDAGGKTISIWAYFEGPALTTSIIADPYVYSTDFVSYDPASFGGQSSTMAVANKWFEIRAVVPKSEAHILTGMDFFTNLNQDGWTGTIYLDDITIK
jgi:hypothetical protein